MQHNIYILYLILCNIKRVLQTQLKEHFAVTLHLLKTQEFKVLILRAELFFNKVHMMTLNYMNDICSTTSKQLL